jgi:hypothetical protein
MKKARTKLTLNRETITSLTNDRLADAAGGALFSGVTVCNSICLTLCNCPSQNTQCITGCLPCGTQTNCIG